MRLARWIETALIANGTSHNRLDLTEEAWASIQSAPDEVDHPGIPEWPSKAGREWALFDGRRLLGTVGDISGILATFVFKVEGSGDG